VSKKIVEESSNKEEDDDSDDESTRYDSDEMTLFIRRFSKMMTKQNFFKGGKKDKFRSKTKRACYNYGKYGHYIANYPHEHMDEENDKKKSYDEAHIDKEWDSDDESSDFDSDGVATMAIKGSSASSKSLFSNLNKGKHTCLMAKESRRKVKSKTLILSMFLVMMI
jgi:flagellar hook assembly protein FlgD